MARVPRLSLPPLRTEPSGTIQAGRLEHFVRTLRDWGRYADAAFSELDAQLTSGAWTPTLTNVAVGEGGSAGASGGWRYANGLLHLRIGITLGTAAFSVTGTPNITLPPGFTQDDASQNDVVGGVSLLAAGNLYIGLAAWGSATSINLYALNVAGTYATRTAITNLIPDVWAANDRMAFRGVLSGAFDQ